MFPNATMMQPGHLDDRAQHDDRGAQRARVELIMAKTPLNIALVGYGFMGRTHSNAFLQAPRFFDLPYQPVLKAVVARNADRVRDVRRHLGLRVRRHGLAGRRRAQGHRSRRHREPERHPRRDRHRRRPRRKDGDLREAARPHRGRGAGDGVGGRRRRRRQHGLVQLPARAGGRAAQEPDRRRQAGAHLSLPRAVSAGLDDLAATCRRAAKGCGASTSASPAAASPATCSRTASTPRSG